jgi:hypothetical protein
MKVYTSVMFDTHYLPGETDRLLATVAVVVDLARSKADVTPHVSGFKTGRLIGKSACEMYKVAQEWSVLNLVKYSTAAALNEYASQGDLFVDEAGVAPRLSQYPRV